MDESRQSNDKNLVRKIVFFFPRILQIRRFFLGGGLRGGMGVCTVKKDFFGTRLGGLGVLGTRGPLPNSQHTQMSKIVCRAVLIPGSDLMTSARNALSTRGCPSSTIPSALLLRLPPRWPLTSVTGQKGVNGSRRSVRNR